MILVDVNLLVYAKMQGMEQHEPARAWLEEKLSGVAGVGLPWSSLLAFARLVSNRRIFTNPMSVQAAWDQVDEWRRLRNVFTPEPADRYPEILAALIPEAGRAELVPDAHLAALSIEYGLTLQTTDRDFARFSRLKWENPLEATDGRGGP
ncbi:MAG: PIN domain-containing protein [Gemmatimonadetes bacterium]|nr:PIN domain-containing protein [Gemmatimonadota bacterium]